MGYTFNIRNKAGMLPVPSWDSPESEQDCYYRADWRETGYKDYSYSSVVIREVLRILRFTGVLVEMEHLPWPEDDAPEEAWNAVLGQMAGQSFRVPSFKFSDSSGWIITPEECLWIAYALRGSDDSWVREFREFCEFAAKRDGISVD